MGRVIFRFGFVFHGMLKADCYSDMLSLKGTDESNDWLINELDRAELAEIDRSIENRTMYVASQPPADIRRRYLSDGKRQIEKSRSSPMAIKVRAYLSMSIDSSPHFLVARFDSLPVGFAPIVLA